MNAMTIQSQLDQVLALADKATPGEWMLATSCSWRRIIAERSHAPVIVPTTQRNDNHPDLDCGEDYVNAELAIAAVNFLRQHGPAIRAAVGGEAVKVAWRFVDKTGQYAYSSWADIGAEIGDHDASRIAIQYAYASPPATVDVVALRELVEKLSAIEQVARNSPRRDDMLYANGIKAAKDELAALIGEEA